MTIPNGDISLLSDNLQELYLAVHSGEEGKDAELISNASGTRVYYATAGWGRLWKTYHSIHHFIFEDNIEATTLKQAMQKTQEIFEIEKSNVIAIFERYKSILEAKMNEESVDNDEFFHVRYQINNWNANTLPFIKLVEKNQNAKLNKVFQQLLLTRENIMELPPPFAQNEALATIARYQAIIDVERIMEFPLPYDILQCLILRHEISDDQEKEIGLWIASLNEKSQILPVNKLRKAFDALVHLIGGRSSSSSSSSAERPTVERLGLELANRSCELFSLDDAKHIVWRESLQPGTAVSCNGTSYILGEMLGIQKSYDKRHIYKIHDCNNAIVIIGNNTMILGIQYLAAKELSWGIRPATWLPVDSKGLCAIVEYLPHPLHIHKWSSTATLTDEDRDCAQPLIGQIVWFLRIKATPLNLNIENLRYSIDGILKSCKIPIQSPSLNFSEIERLVIDATNTNPTVFKYIMQESGMEAHQYARYYREIIDKALSGEDIKAEDLAAYARYQIIEPNIIDRANALCKEIQQLKISLLNRLSENYNITDSEQAAVWIHNTMKAVFILSKTASILWPTFESDTLDLVVNENSLTQK